MAHPCSLWGVCVGGSLNKPQKGGGPLFSWTDLKCRGKTHISWKVAFSLQGGWCLIPIVPCSHRGHPKYLTMQHTLSLLNRASPGGVFTAVYARTKGAKALSNSQGSLRLLSCRTASPQDSTPPITLSSSSFMEDQQGPCPLPLPPSRCSLCPL